MVLLPNDSRRTIGASICQAPARKIWKNWKPSLQKGRKNLRSSLVSAAVHPPCYLLGFLGGMVWLVVCFRFFVPWLVSFISNCSMYAKITIVFHQLQWSNPGVEFIFSGKTFATICLVDIGYFLVAVTHSSVHLKPHTHQGRWRRRTQLIPRNLVHLRNLPEAHSMSKV